MIDISMSDTATHLVLVLPAPHPLHIDEPDGPARIAERPAGRVPLGSADRRLAPPAHVPEVHLPGRAAEAPAGPDLARQSRIELDHPADQSLLEHLVLRGQDEPEVLVGQGVHEDLGEAVEEGLGEAAASAALA